MQATEVVFPEGRTEATATVVFAEQVGDLLAVVTDLSPFHPLDHTWPDQPADRGTLGGREVLDCATGAFGPDGNLRVGAEIPARRGDPQWTWVVVHYVSLGDSLPAIGDPVQLTVEAEYRHSLSAAHTACHLAALALNQATAGLWRKPAPRTDSLGGPDLDALAISASRIGPWHSEDSYRLGKSLGKKGFAAPSLLDSLPEIALRVTERLQSWRATGAAVAIETGGDRGLAARRTWTCVLPEGVARYPCGGTHVGSLAELPASTRVSYRATPDGFVADTTLAPGE